MEVVLKGYQKENAYKAALKLQEYHIAYLGMEMRTGKTFTALYTAMMMNKMNVLFITTKKAVPSIFRDYKSLSPKYKLTVIVNDYRNIEKLRDEYDLIIVDEAHKFGAFPKASNRTKRLRSIIKENDLILMSGTPSPETSGTQLYHQFYLSINTPFKEKKFYEWASKYVDIKTKYVNGIIIKDYKAGKYDEIMNVVGKYFVNYTQKEAGIQCEIIEQVHKVKINPDIYKLIKILKKEKMYRFKKLDEQVVCDTAVKEMNKIHQLCSGTIITESGKRLLLDNSKVNYIKQHFNKKKIAIFYRFIAEGDILKKEFPNWTDKDFEFNNSDKLTYICQVISGQEGTDLSSADDLIFYNIHHSSVTYWQARSRLSNLKRKRACHVHWLFSSLGIEQHIYQAVLNKKNYTSYLYRRDYEKIGEQNTRRDYQIHKGVA